MSLFNQSYSQMPPTRSISDTCVNYNTWGKEEKISDIPLNNDIILNRFSNTSLTSDIKQSYSNQDFILTGENHENKKC